MRMNSSSSVAAPCSCGKRFGSPSSRILPCDKNKHAVAHLLDLEHVVRRPEDAAVAFARELADPRADDLRGGRVERSGRLVEQQQLRPVQQRLRERGASLLAGRQQAALRVAQVLEIELLEHLFDSPREPAHSVDQAEHAQVLRDREVARQRRVDRREVGLRERERAPARDVDAADLDRARGRREHAEHGVDDRGLARAVRPEQAEDLVAPDHERHVIDRDESSVGLAEIVDREHVARVGGHADPIRRTNSDCRRRSLRRATSRPDVQGSPRARTVANERRLAADTPRRCDGAAARGGVTVKAALILGGTP